MTRRRKKLLALLAAAFTVLALVVALELVFSGPHMETQVNLRHQQWNSPLPPEHAVPADEAYSPGNSGLAAAEQNEQNLAVGEAWYRYSCLMCHGETGSGRGPVGISYVPAPADLASRRIQRMTDAELARAMLTGVGHEPVLKRVVPRDHRSKLLLYLRWLADNPARTSQDLPPGGLR